MQNHNTQEKKGYTREELIKLFYFVSSGFGFIYWVIFLVIHPLDHFSGKLIYMTIPYSVMGFALLMVSRDAFRAKHYGLSFHFYVGLLIAGSLA